MWADIFSWSPGIAQHSEGAAPQDVGVPSAGLDKCLSGGPVDGSCGHRDAREQTFNIVFTWLNELLIFKIFIEFVMILLLFHVLVLWTQGMLYVSSLTRTEPTLPELEGKVPTTGWSEKLPLSLQ